MSDLRPGSPHGRRQLPRVRRAAARLRPVVHLGRSARGLQADGRQQTAGGLIFFEVDQQTVQDHKRSALAQAGIDTTDTRFVVVDFSEDDLFEKLVS
ncbi:MAG: class I SAM-dependent methyltransferase, partial [Myxococcales bacterium]|nr:class I SAM-dependent methyltransferase [Myxococcales bacterium]